MILFWKCPEVVRINNCTAWRAMSTVLTAIPRVVHPDDVYSGAVHVAEEVYTMFAVCVVTKILQRAPRRERKRKDHSIWND
jgi:hypothetical protein